MNVAVLFLLLFLSLDEGVYGYHGKRGKKGKGDAPKTASASKRSTMGHNIMSRHRSSKGKREGGPTSAKKGNEKKGMPWRNYYKKHNKNPNLFFHSSRKPRPKPTTKKPASKGKASENKNVKKDMPWRQFYKKHNKNPNFFFHSKPKRPRATPAPTRRGASTPLPTSSSTAAASPGPTSTSTPQPTATPTTTTPQASLYYTAWLGVSDDNDICNRPQPGLQVSCGVGATLDILNSTSNSQCSPVGAGALSCSATFNDVDIVAWVVYACIGTTEQQWTTQVDAIPDTSVQCSQGGAVGTRIFLSQRCPGSDGDNFNEMQCSPASALGTNSDGLNSCLAFDVCTTPLCSLSTPALGSSINISTISRDCLFEVSGGSGTPATSPPPTPTSGEIMSHWYQAEWTGVITEAELCEDPAPGAIISCGPGGSISVLDLSPVTTCQFVSGTEQISCTGLPSEESIPGVLYSCHGNTVVSWTTRVEAVPDPSVSCQGGGAAGTRILIGKRCPNTPNSVDYNDVKCDPRNALSVLPSGEDTCLTFDTCQQETCNLVTLPVAAEIPEASIVPSCLRPP